MTQICHINLLPSVHGKKTDRLTSSQEHKQTPRGNSAKTRNEELGSVQPQSTLSKALGSILRVTYTQEEYTYPILHVKIFQYVYTYINDEINLEKLIRTFKIETEASKLCNQHLLSVCQCFTKVRTTVLSVRSSRKCLYLLEVHELNSFALKTLHETQTNMQAKGH